LANEGRTDPIDEGMLRTINCAFDAGDCDEICMAIGIVLQKRNVSEVARASGTKRETIHRAFLSGETHPNLRTLVVVLAAIGLKIQIRPKGRSSRAKP
jgi:probable addiction module antidote protein